MRVSVIIVQYRTPELVPACLRALEPVLSRPDAECVIVDNDEQGSEPADARSEKQSRARWVAAGRNLGYAGGINLGVEQTSGDLIVAMNPDVLVEPGCLERLCQVLEAGAEIAGPRFYWDQELRLMIPPAEERSRWSELLTVLASRGPRFAARARERWRDHARRHWRSSDPLDSWDLSGALLAFRRSTYHRIGPFDTAYRLYFEETDWLARAQRDAAIACYVPDAVAVHLYDQAAKVEAASPKWFAESAARFRRRHYGRVFDRLLALVERPLDSVERPLAEPDPETRLLEGGEIRAPKLPHLTAASATRERADDLERADSIWLELSPRRLGFPSVGEKVSVGEAWAPPRSLSRWHAGTRLWGRWVAESGREVGDAFTLRVGAVSDLTNRV